MAKKRTEVARITERGYWSEEDARVVAEAWQESGETTASFARRHGVHAKRVARWVKRLQETEERAPSSFFPVRVVRRGDADSSMCPRTSGSTSITWPNTPVARARTA
jgi:transposase-like protein